MKKFAVYALAGMLAFPISGAAAQYNQKGGLKPIQVPPAQTPTPVGFASVLCVVNGLSGASLFEGSTFSLNGFTVEGSNLVVGTSPVTSTILVTIINDKTLSSGTYTVTFVDNNTDSKLDCGDTIVSIVPAS